MCHNARVLDLFSYSFFKMCVSVLPEYMGVYHIMPGAFGNQKKMLDLLELELQMIVSCNGY